MIAKLYYPDKYNNRTSINKVKKLLIKGNIEFTEQPIEREPLIWEQLLEILTYTEDGVDDILATGSKDYKTLIEQGIVFEDLSLSELLTYFNEYPKLLKSPVLVYKSITLSGYNEEEMSVLKDRKERKESFIKC